MLTPEVTGRVESVRRALEHARALPMSSSVVVNKAELIGMLDDLEDDCRVSLEAAQSVVGKRDEVLAAARDEAQEMIREAKLERDRLVADTEVFRVATRNAKEAVAAATEEAQALRQETDGYVAERLAAFEDTLGTTLEAARRGRQKLEKNTRRPGQPAQQQGGPGADDRTAPGGSASPFAALANDSDVDDIVLPEHLER